MPTIPISQGPSLREQGLPSAYQRAPGPSISDRAMAGGLDAAAQAAGQIAEREARLRADQTDTEVAAGWLQWDAENRPKYQGERASEYQAEAEKWWKSTAERYGQTMDPLSRSMASPALMRRQTAALGQVAGFVGAEKEKHADQVAAAGIDTTIQFGVTSGDVAGAAQRVRELAAQVGARKGWTTEQVQAEQAKHLSMLHLAQIAKLTETDPAAAQAYYDANKAGVGFAQQARVESIIKAEVDNQAAVQFAAQNAALPYDEQLAKAGAITDPKRREKTLAAIKDAQAQVREAQALRERQMKDKAWQLVGQGKRVPEIILASMDGKERVQLQEHIRAAAERRAGGGSVKTDWATYIDLRERLARGEKVELRAYTEKVAPGQLEQLLDIQTKASKPAKAPEVATAEQQLSATVGAMDLGSGSAARERKGQFVAAAQDMFNEHAKRTGKEPDFSERQAILDKLTVEVVTKKGMLWDTKGPVYTLPREEIRRQFSPGQLPRVRTVEEARALPAGTRFIDPQGVERVR